MEKGKRYYYQAMSMAEYILERHSKAETASEFGICQTTVTYRINYLASANPSIYKKVIDYWHKQKRHDSFEGLVI